MALKNKKFQVFVSQTWLDEISKVIRNGKRGQVLRACLLMYSRNYDFRRQVDLFIEKTTVKDGVV